MRPDIVPGGRFPDYELTDHTRTRRTLSELQGNDPMILVLSRGQPLTKMGFSPPHAAGLEPWRLGAPGLSQQSWCPPDVVVPGWNMHV